MLPLRTSPPGPLKERDRSADSGVVGVHNPTLAATGSRALSLRLGRRGRLVSLVGASFLARAVAAIATPTPSFFPDEYIYSALGRSIGETGRPLIRGEAAHFPALLEPILAAPLWRLASIETAYHLVQVENALFMSLAAIPAYLLARRLELSSTYSLACAAFAVAVPDLVFASYTLADPVAYPLVVAALYAGVVALQAPSPRADALFLALAGLASFARVQYVVLVPAFLGAAILLERRRTLRAHVLPSALLACVAVAAAGLGMHTLLGYYSGVGRLHLGMATLRWALLDVLLLTLAAGVVLVPGAVIALVRPRGRDETAFALMSLLFAFALLVEAGLYASNGSDRFQERYLFSLLPLVPIAFGVYLRNGRPGRLAAWTLAAAVLAASARLPLSGYAAGIGTTDSPLLASVMYLDGTFGIGNGATIFAAYAALAAIGAAVVARRGGARVAIGGTLAFMAVVSGLAAWQFHSEGRSVRDRFVSPNASWVDDQGLHGVTAVQTRSAPPAWLHTQLFWNRSITRELVLDGATATDAFAAPQAHIARDGILRSGGTIVRAPILFQGYASTAVFDDARLLARWGNFTLWRPNGAARLRLLEAGRFGDGWLSQAGRLTVWPDGSGQTRGTLTFTLTLPLDRAPVAVRFGAAAYRMTPGERLPLRYRLDHAGPWSIDFRSDSGTYLSDRRPVSVRSTAPTFVRTAR